MEQRIREAIAKVEVIADSGASRVMSRGTGFLVSEDLALTALHVVADRATDPPQFLGGRIRLSFPGATTEVEVVEGMWDRNEDWVLLRCLDKVSARPIPIGNWQSSGSEFETYGFPDANPRDGMVQTGTVENHLADLDGVHAYQLFSKQAAAGDGAPVKGLSGGPLIIENAVVGLMRFALMNKQKQTVAGTVYACPLALVCETVGTLLPIPDPCLGLPGLPHRALPAKPFRYLQRFSDLDAEIFFGRNAEIRELCEQISSPDSPLITFLFGQSGVGKSSFLDAGVLPRLSWNYEIRYIRRNPRISLLETLLSSLAGNDGTQGRSGALAQAWRTAELRSGKPLVVVFDQIEEVYTRPLVSRANELQEFFAALAELVGGRGSDFAGRLILAFRKEWFPELHKQLAQQNIGHGNIFLEELGREAVCEVVTGLTATSRLLKQYALQVEDGLPVMIADDLVADRDSPVAPVLQVLLTRMWREAFTLDPSAPAFTTELYLNLRNQGLLLGDFMDQQFARLNDTHPRDVSSGLALDLLAYHTTTMSTAAEKSHQQLLGDYHHVSAGLPSLLQAMTDLYLLSGSVLTDGTGATRLAHDTLAPVVRSRIHYSNQPGQRARLVLENRAKEWRGKQRGAPLDEWDLKLVENGLQGMRDLETDEREILDASRQSRNRKHRKLRRNRRLAITAVVAVIGLAGWAWVEKNIAERQVFLTELARSTDLVARYLSTKPVLGVMHAIAAVGKSQHELGPGNVGPELQFSLNKAINESWEVYIIDHGAEVTAVAMHPSGEAFASADKKGSIRLWRLPGVRSSANPVSFPPQGEKHDGQIPWAIPHIPGKPLVFAERGEPVNSLAFSPDGSHMAIASSDATLRLWDLNKKSFEYLPGPNKALQVVKYDPRGDYLLAAGDGGALFVWDAEGTLKNTLSVGESTRIRALAISADSEHFVTGYDTGDVEVWRGLAAPVSVAKFKAHAGGVNALAFHPSAPNYFASGGGDQLIKTWSLEDGPPSISISRESDAAVLTLAFRGDGQALVSGGADNLVRLTDVKDDSLLGDLISPPFRGIDGDVTSVSVSPNNQHIIVGSNDNKVRIADWLSSQVDVPRNPEFLPRFVSIAGNSSSVSAFGVEASSLSYKTWSRLESSKPLPKSLLGATRGRSLTISEGAKILSVSGTGDKLLLLSADKLSLVDFSDNSQSPLQLSVTAPLVATLSHKGKLLAIADSASLQIVDSATGEVLQRLERQGAPLEFLAFSRDSRTLAGASKQAAGLWMWRDENPAKGRVTTFDPNQPTMFIPISFASLAGLENDSDSHAISSLAVANNGARLAVGTRTGDLHLWHKDRDKGHQVQSIKAHNGIIYQSEFRPPDDQALLTAGASSMGLWDMKGNQLAAYVSHGEAVTDLQFSDDGHFAASSGKDRSVRVWATHWKQWMNIGCRRLRYHAHYGTGGKSEKGEESDLIDNAKAVCKEFAPQGTDN